MAKPKIIVWDIEILADMDKIRDNWFRVYSPYKNNGFSGELSSVLCIGWKELGSKKVNCINAWDHKSRWKKNKNDDLAVLKEFAEVMKDADGQVTHNGKKFDLPFVNTRLLLHGLPPLPPVKHIDTKNLSSRNLRLISSSLGNVAGFLGTDAKVDSGGQKLWNDVHDNKRSALKKMEYYCKHDVKATEGILDRLKPFAKQIPNYNWFLGKDADTVCQSCGSEHLQKYGTRKLKTKTMQRWRCNECASMTETKLEN